ncbi:hypothetical protein M758_1G215800 [Ceratodon purpureus]|nr:hypothetical protein M758_1G215800 [Ceratodon purpureus]
MALETTPAEYSGHRSPPCCERRPLPGHRTYHAGVPARPLDKALLFSGSCRPLATMTSIEFQVSLWVTVVALRMQIGDQFDDKF